VLCGVPIGIWRKRGETQTKGMIISRTGETLIVSGPNGHVTVVLTEDTKTKDDRGLFGLATEEMADTVLIPGLKVRVDGEVADSQGRLVAKTITVDGDDLETAEMIQAVLRPTAEQVAANMQAIERNKKNIAANQQDMQQISGISRQISRAVCRYGISSRRVRWENMEQQHPTRLRRDERRTVASKSKYW